MLPFSVLYLLSSDSVIVLSRLIIHRDPIDQFKDYLRVSRAVGTCRNYPVGLTCIKRESLYIWGYVKRARW